MDAILVTGATGNVGQEVVRALLRRGAPVIAADHRPDRVAARFGDAVVAARLDFKDRGTWASAVERAKHMFLMRPPAIADVQNNLNPFIDEARSRGIDHVVFLSVAGAGRNRLVPHRKVEDHLRARGDHYTNLRPGFFAQNLQSAYLKDIVEDDRIYVPAGRKPVNWIDVRDVAEVAALVLSAPEAHRGQSYTLAGPGPVPWSVVTAALTEALGRPIRYEPASLLGYIRHLSRRGEPRGAILVQTILHFLLRLGQGATVDPTLERLLGRPGRSIREFVFEHAGLWAKTAH
ncbi:MAG TPA: NmrA family NAD(P)-binding protein [Polyangia bacterium]|nr:NmrA family NAD(P)-binding protein [Polyangia bacterium]